MARKKGRARRPKTSALAAGGSDQTGLAALAKRAEMFLKTTWGRATAVLTLLGIAFSFTANFTSSVEQLPRTVARISEWWSIDSNYSGTWTNDAEGMSVAGPPTVPAYVPPPSDQGAVSLDIELRDGELTGEITSRVITENFPYSHVFVIGEKRWGRVEFVVWDMKGGEAVTLAALEMKHTTVDGEERLMVQTHRQTWPGMFPERFYVWRGDMPEPTSTLMRTFELRHQNEQPVFGKNSERVSIDQLSSTPPVPPAPTPDAPLRSSTAMPLPDQ
ncbi:hypothetical protein ACW7G0_11285 [Lysobacter sp. A286]